MSSPFGTISDPSVGIEIGQSGVKAVGYVTVSNAPVDTVDLFQIGLLGKDFLEDSHPVIEIILIGDLVIEGVVELFKQGIAVFP